MQIWIFFHAGSGGDGLANLLEQACNVVAIDGDKNWRIHRVVDGKVKFYAPNLDQRGCFRLQHLERFDHENNCLAQGYLDAVQQKQNCIVTSHDVTLDYLRSSDCQNIFQQNIIKILVTCDDLDYMQRQASIKNLQNVLVPTTAIHPDSTLFDHVVDIDLAQKNWSYVQDLCNSIGVHLSEDSYRRYQDILSGSMTYLDKNFDIEIYESFTTNDGIGYRLLQIWQPTRPH